jgi:cob(I)alamin adenosyltransferase
MSKQENITGLFRKTGDCGMTDLASGKKISKSSSKVDLIGDIDELISALGVARAHNSSKKLNAEICVIQKNLFFINSEIAGYITKGAPTAIDEKFLHAFEERIKPLKASLPQPQGFILPGNSLTESYLHVSRAITRRCERKAVALFEQNEIQNKIILAFLNRLSSFLFLLASAQVKKPLYLKNI